MRTRIPLNLVYEDALSGEVLWKIVSMYGKFDIQARLTRGGNQYIRKHIKSFNEASRVTPYLILTDLDNHNCVVEFMENWIPAHTRNKDFIFRVAVREVESWLLADTVNLSSYLGVSQNHLERLAPDEVGDPKKTLINIASRSRISSIRSDIVPPQNSSRIQGPGYNIALQHFVSKLWNIEQACNRSHSLKKTVEALNRYTYTI